MTERSHIGKRQRYVEFRFEDSLRRYQPPLRKLVKLNESLCGNCFRRSCQSEKQSRLIRLCQTRKFYNATSRQKASQYSRKKQARQSNSEKASGHVSDFNCHQNEASQPKQNSIQFECQLMINQIPSSKSVINMVGDNRMVNWSISIQQTPIKQSIREQLRHICSSQKSHMSQQKQQTDMNSFKVKDIDFHIGMVEQLHQKIINQYMKLQIQPLSIEEPIQYNERPSEQDKFINNLQSIQKQNLLFYSTNQQIKEQTILQTRQISNNKDQQVMDAKLIEKENQEINIMQLQNNKAEIEEKRIQINSGIEQITENTDNIEHGQTCKQTQPQHTGRIQLKGEKGSCFISIRILNKLLSSNLSPKKVTSTLVRHHPYLGDISHVLQIITEKNIGDRFIISQF